MYPKLKIILRSRHDAHEKHIACLTEWSIRHCIYSAVQRMLWTRAACTVHQFVCSSLPESDHGPSEVVGYHIDLRTQLVTLVTSLTQPCPVLSTWVLEWHRQVTASQEVRLVSLSHPPLSRLSPLGTSLVQGVTSLLTRSFMPHPA